MRKERDELVHLTFATEGRHVLFADEASRRAAVRALTRVRGVRILLFCVVDDHVHVVFWARPSRQGALKKAFHNVLAPVAQVRVLPGRLRRVNGRSHLWWLVRYLLAQVVKHGLSAHPALWCGSCFLDLIGARWLPSLVLHITDALPRLTRGEVLAAVGLDRMPRPLEDAEIRGLGARRLVAAAAAAACAEPALRGNRQEVVQARRAAVRLGVAAGMTVSELAWALGASTRTVQRLKHADVEEALIEAVRVRLALEEVVDRSPVCEV